jgi:murein DD-endopeptidase MepM/ murein hydrolase activator NlpD
LSQHRNSTKSDSTALLIGNVVTSKSSSKGRHRAPTRMNDRTGVAATVAVAAGALIATGYQVSNPATAQAAPDGAAPAIPGLPIEISNGLDQLNKFTESLTAAPEAATPEAAPVAGPELPALPPEITNGIEQLNKLGQDFAAQFAPRAPVVRPVNGAITSGYGARWGAMHSGLDFADAIGTPIASVSNGVVIEAGPASGFGLWVRVKQDDGTTAVYGHVNDITTFVGKRVTAGETIATVGNRGYSTGPHLHLEIWHPSGVKLNPANWLTTHGVKLGLGAANA